MSIKHLYISFHSHVPIDNANEQRHSKPYNLTHNLFTYIIPSQLIVVYPNL